MNPSLSSPPAPGACYKFTVASAEEAARTIRERLGPQAQVLSVRTLPASGWRRFWSAPRLEVVAQMEREGPAAGAVAAEPEGTDPAVEAFPAARREAPSLPLLLRRSGLSDVALGRLQADPAWPSWLDLPLHRALVEVGTQLKRRAAARSLSRPLQRAAFIGTAGCGRTTALCKWLGAEVFGRGRRGRVMVAEFERPNPAGVLTVFCEALGVAWSRAAAAPEPQTAEGFLYYDLPGISLARPAENRALADFLEREGIEQRILVLNAAYDHATLRAAYAEGRALGATHLVFTHLDEVPLWGRLWEYLCDGGLEPLFVANGPALTGECDEDVWGAVVRRTLAAGASGPEAPPATRSGPAAPTSLSHAQP